MTATDTAMDPRIPRRLEKNTNIATMTFPVKRRPKRSDLELMRCPPLVPDVAEQRAVARQMGSGTDRPVPDGRVSLGPGAVKRLVSRSLAHGEDECVCYGAHQLPIPITVVLLASLPGGGSGGHDVPFLMGRRRTPLVGFG